MIGSRTAGKEAERQQLAANRLVAVVEELSRAKDLASVTAAVRDAARDLLGADGATFVLRDGDRCYYADENAISPLWKGQRFPMSACISGWVMLNGRPAVIDDIYDDPRIPQDAYRPTFVRSLAMVPIRLPDPIGAIGNYWAEPFHPSATDIEVLQALASVTAVALENVDLYARLTEKVETLERTNEELGRFVWAASHDLKSPLHAIRAISVWLDEDIASGSLEAARENLGLLVQRATRMERLLEDLLAYSQSGAVLDDGTYMCGCDLIEEAVGLLEVPAGFDIEVDPAFAAAELPRVPLQQVFCNLIGNAIKHHHTANGQVRIELETRESDFVIGVRDDGPGIAPQYHRKIFELFQTLQRRDEKEGSGIGLAMVEKILARHGSEISLESAPGCGSVFRFTWPRPLGRLPLQHAG